VHNRHSQSAEIGDDVGRMSRTTRTDDHMPHVISLPRPKVDDSRDVLRIAVLAHDEVRRLTSRWMMWLRVPWKKRHDGRIVGATPALELDQLDGPESERAGQHHSLGCQAVAESPHRAATAARAAAALRPGGGAGASGGGGGAGVGGLEEAQKSAPGAGCRTRQGLSRTGSGGLLGASSLLVGLGLAAPVAVALDGDDVGMMNSAIDERGSAGGVGEDRRPVAKRLSWWS
jgi:hypothetical protein